MLYHSPAGQATPITSPARLLLPPPHRHINRLAADPQLQKVCNFPAGLVNILLVTMTNLEFCLRSRAWTIVWRLVRSYENIKISDRDWPLVPWLCLVARYVINDCLTLQQLPTSFVSVKIFTSLLDFRLFLISNIRTDILTTACFILANSFCLLENDIMVIRDNLKCSNIARIVVIPLIIPNVYQFLWLQPSVWCFTPILSSKTTLTIRLQPASHPDTWQFGTSQVNSDGRNW